MLATFYTFTKRKNSTAIPNQTSDWHPEILLKEPTDIVNPTLKLGSQLPIETVTSYNYVTFGGRYYFINSWESYRNDLWLAHCTLDYMATYRDYILATSAFIEYDTTPNAEIVDMRLHLKASEIYGVSVATFAPALDSGGTYVLTVTGRGGSVGFFGMSANALGMLLDDLAHWVTNEIEDTGSTPESVIAFARQMCSGGSAVNNLRGCTWIPWVAEGTSENIWLGNFDTGKAGRNLNETPIKKTTYQLEIPWKASDWRRSSYCTNLALKLPFVGKVALNPGDLKTADVITIRQNIDFRTGDVAYHVFAGNGDVIGLFGGSAGVSVPIGSASPNHGAQLSAGIGLIQNLMTGNFVGAQVGAGQLANTILNPSTTMIGSMGAAASASSGFNNLVELECVFHDTNVPPESVSSAIGTPSFAVKQIGSLSGFVKTRAVSVAAPCGEQILSVINQTLDKGAFIE